MAQQGEHLPCSPDNLTPTLRTCMKVGRELSPPNCPLTATYVLWHTWTCTHAHGSCTHLQ